MDRQFTANLVLIQSWTHTVVTSSDVSELSSQLATFLSFYESRGPTVCMSMWADVIVVHIMAWSSIALP